MAQRKYYIINSHQTPNWLKDLNRLLYGNEFSVFYAAYLETFAAFQHQMTEFRARRAPLSYSALQKLTNLSRSTIDTALNGRKDKGGLLAYDILKKVPGPASKPTGQEYYLNIVAEQQKKRDGVVWVSLSNRLMNIAGLELRAEQDLITNRHRTAKGRAQRSANVVADHATKDALLQQQDRSVKQTSNRSVKQTSNRSVKQTDHNNDICNDLHNDRIHPFHSPLDPKTGKQKRMDAWMDESQQLFLQLEEKRVLEDKRVQRHLPKTTIPIQAVFRNTMRLREINVFQLRQLINGILADTTIDNPLAALQKPDVFHTEYYINFIPRKESPGEVHSFRQGENFQWENIQVLLEGHMRNKGYNIWSDYNTFIRPTTATLQKNTLVWNVPDEAFCWWLWEKGQTLTLDIIEQNMGIRPEIAFTVNGEPVDMSQFKNQEATA
jgi:hypothetical protein